MSISLRVFCVSVAVLLGAGIASADSTATTLGDINGDGVINVLDVQASIAQTLQSLPQTTAADVDESGQVDIGDIQNLINTSLATGGLVQRITGTLNAAANLLAQGISLAAVAQDGTQVTVTVDASTGTFSITLPVKEEWSLVFATDEASNGQQDAGSVTFTINGDSSTVLPLPDLSQCDVLDLGTLNFASEIPVATDIRSLLGSINNKDLLTDADANGIPDFLDTLLAQISSLPILGCTSTGEGEGESESVTGTLGLPCLDVTTLTELVKSCVQTNLTAITDVSLVDANDNGVPDFIEPFLGCLHDAIVTWLQDNGVTIPVDSLVSQVMQAIEGTIPSWIAGLKEPNLTDTQGDGIPDHLRDLVGKPGLPAWRDTDGNGVPDVLQHHHGGEGEGEGEGEGVQVPDVIGMTLTDAQTAIAAAGLIGGTLAQEYSANITYGLVMREHPDAGVTVPVSTPVDIVISKGPRPGEVTVPNVVGMAQADAEAAITAATLVVGKITERYSDSVAAGQVISQVPTADAQVLPGEPVNLAVSKGPDPNALTVPNIIGLSQADAQAAITAAGLTVGQVGEEYSDTVAAGVVILQHPSAGDSIPAGRSVDFVLSKGPHPTPVTVPDVVGMTQAAAEAAITAAGLATGMVAQDFNDTVAAGSVMAQQPAAGQAIAPGGFVILVVSKGPRPAGATVPNVVGMTVLDAQAAIANAGLMTGMVKPQNSATVPLGQIISQRPEAGTTVQPNSEVNLVVSTGSFSLGTITGA